MELGITIGGRAVTGSELRGALGLGFGLQLGRLEVKQVKVKQLRVEQVNATQVRVKQVRATQVRVKQVRATG